MSNTIESIYSDIRKLFSVQLHEFFRQYKEKTIDPEKLLENFDENNNYLIKIIEHAETMDEEKFGIREQLDVATAEFMLAFLMKLDEAFPQENILDESEED